MCERLLDWARSVSEMCETLHEEINKFNLVVSSGGFKYTTSKELDVILSKHHSNLRDLEDGVFLLSDLCNNILDLSKRN